MPRSVAIAIAILLATIVGASAQVSAPPPPPSPRPVQTLSVLAGDASIAGLVTDNETRRPLAGALVQLASADMRRILMTQTNADGKFAFDAIAGGEYRITVKHDGYVDQAYGVPDANFGSVSPDAVIQLERRARREIAFALARSAGITGRVTRDDGRPLANASVSMVMTAENGSYRMSSRWFSRTDERGNYVIPNVPPGDYRVSAVWTDPETVSSTRNMRPREIYYPGTEKSSEATTVALPAGRMVDGIDIRIPGSELLRIQGKVVAGTVVAPFEAYLFAGSSLQSLKIADDGGFSTPRLPVGRYTLIVRAKNDDSSEAASFSVDLTAELTDIVLGLMPTGRITGRIVADDGSSLPDTMQVAAVLADQGKEIDHLRRDRAYIGGGGTFELKDLFAESVLQVVGFTDGWTVDRVLVGNSSVTSLTVDPGRTIDDVKIVLTRKR